MIHPFFSPFSRFQQVITDREISGTARWQRCMLDLRKQALERSLGSDGLARTELTPEQIDWGFGAGFNRWKQRQKQADLVAATGLDMPRRLWVMDCAGPKLNHRLVDLSQGGNEYYPMWDEGYDILARPGYGPGGPQMSLHFQVEGQAASEGRLWLAFMVRDDDREALKKILPVPYGQDPVAFAAEPENFDDQYDGPLSDWWANLPMTGGSAAFNEETDASRDDGTYIASRVIPLAEVGEPRRYPGLPKDYAVVVALSEPVGVEARSM